MSEPTDRPALTANLIRAASFGSSSAGRNVAGEDTTPCGVIVGESRVDEQMRYLSLSANSCCACFTLAFAVVKSVLLRCEVTVNVSCGAGL